MTLHTRANALASASVRCSALSTGGQITAAAQPTNANGRISKCASRHHLTEKEIRYAIGGARGVVNGF